MSRPAAAARQKPEPTIRRARFAEEDLVSTFGEVMLAEARRLLRAGAVNLAAAGPAIEATIAADGEHHCVALTPTQRGAKSETMALVVPESEEWPLKLCCQDRARGRSSPCRGDHLENVGLDQIGRET